MKILDVGAGPSSSRSHQIDIVKYPNTTHVLDAMMEPWPFKNLHFDEVRMEQFLERCPPVVKYFDGSWKTHYPIVHCMKEAHRVLVYGGFLLCSVPSSPEVHSQDPTHIGPLWTESRFNYFCGEWGGGEEGSFAYVSYGITFAFQKIRVTDQDNILTIRMKKV